MLSGLPTSAGAGKALGFNGTGGGRKGLKGKEKAIMHSVQP